MSASPMRGREAAAVPRRPTADPRRFLIPEEELPPGFAELVDRPPAPPARARPASTVVLMREGADGPEVLLLQRPERSAFAAGAWVFPGGRVDEEDASEVLRARAAGPSPEEWAARLGMDDPAEAFAYVAAAVREAWEETGIVLAPDADACGPREMARREEARRALLAGETDLAGAAERAGVRPSTADVLYLAHWITPVVEPRRYDTRFFLARVPAGSECRLHGDELADAAWITPAEALERFRSGRMKLLPPTAHTLERLVEPPSLDGLWSTLRGGEVPAFLPRMRRVEGGVEIEI